MVTIDTEIYKCNDESHVFRVIELNGVRDIPDNMRCECGKCQHGDIIK